MKTINVKLPDHVLEQLKRVAEDSGRTYAKVIELALVALEGETRVEHAAQTQAMQQQAALGNQRQNHFNQQQVRPVMTVDEIRSVATVVIDTREPPAGSEGPSSGNAEAAPHLADSSPSDPADSLDELLAAFGDLE